MKRFLILTAGIVLLLAGCHTEKQREQSLSFFAMDTYMTLRAFDVSPEILDSLRDQVESLEAIFSVTDRDSEVFRLNESGQISPSPELRELVSRGLALCAETQGALDISIYPLLKAWGFTGDSYRIPGDDEIKELLLRVDYRNILLSDASLSMAPGMSLDLGSLAKGYAADKGAALLRQAGASSALLDLGGNIMAVGSKADGSPWRIGIRNPQGEGQLAVLSVSDEAVVTSGAYERYFTGEDGRVYGHILDPATGWPVQSGLLSVTVVGKSGLRCDALSTALFVMGEEKALDFWQKSGDFEMVLINQSGEILVTEGLAERISLPEESPYRQRVIGA